MWRSRNDASTSLMSAAMCRADNGVCSAGLMTTVFPQHRAGAIFHANIISGKFHCGPGGTNISELQQYEEVDQWSSLDAQQSLNCLCKCPSSVQYKRQSVANIKSDKPLWVSAFDHRNLQNKCVDVIFLMFGHELQRHVLKKIIV